MIQEQRNVKHSQRRDENSMLGWTRGPYCQTRSVSSATSCSLQSMFHQLYSRVQHVYIWRRQTLPNSHSVKRSPEKQIAAIKMKKINSTIIPRRARITTLFEIAKNANLSRSSDVLVNIFILSYWEKSPWKQDARSTSHNIECEGRIPV